MIEASTRRSAAAGARLPGDKPPNDLLFLRMLVKVGGIPPDAKIIHIVRDVRDVVVSLDQTGWVHNLNVYFARFWSSSNLYLHSLTGRSRPGIGWSATRTWCGSPTAACARSATFSASRTSERRSIHSRDRRMAHHAKLYSPHLHREHRRLPAPGPAISRYETQAREALDVLGYPLSRPGRGFIAATRR